MYGSPSCAVAIWMSRPSLVRLLVAQELLALAPSATLIESSRKIAVTCVAHGRDRRHEVADLVEHRLLGRVSARAVVVVAEHPHPPKPPLTSVPCATSVVVDEAVRRVRRHELTARAARGVVGILETCALRAMLWATLLLQPRHATRGGS